MREEVVNETEYDGLGRVTRERRVARRNDSDHEQLERLAEREPQRDWLYEAAGLVLLLTGAGFGLWMLADIAARHMPPAYFTLIVGALSCGLWAFQVDFEAPLGVLVRAAFIAFFTVSTLAGVLALVFFVPAGFGYLACAVGLLFLWGLLRQHKRRD